MTKDEMIGWFKSAPMGSRHQRMLWAAHKIARLTGVTEGGTYQMLLVALIEAGCRGAYRALSRPAGRPWCAGQSSRARAALRPPECGS
jgi:hypothetical protein